MKSTLKLQLLLALATPFAVTLPSFAQQAPASAAAVAATASEGEVKKVDKDAGKVTIKHGELKNLEMPAMTMVFRTDPAILEQVKPGDKISFVAEKVNGQFKATKVQVKN